MQVTSLLYVLLLAGLLGMVGQGARTIVGLKKLHDINASQPPGEQDTFLASRMFVSLLIGFIAGVLAALALGIGKLLGPAGFSSETLLGLIAAGYAGTDFIEGFMEKAPIPAVATGDRKAAVQAGQGDQVSSTTQTGSGGRSPRVPCSRARALPDWMLRSNRSLNCGRRHHSSTPTSPP